MFGPELDEYLSTPAKNRTPEQRSEAYIRSYADLVDWWKAFQKRNPDTPIMRSENAVINVPDTIAQLIEKRDSFIQIQRRG